MYIRVYDIGEPAWCTDVALLPLFIEPEYLRPLLDIGGPVNSTRTRLIADNDAINVAVLATGVINHARELGVEVDTVVRARVGSRQFDVLLRVVRERLR
ncbi:uncharacterized protein AMSG_01688 [Thecamonas trahens ATCC 50062]|uniref:Uncharacterized protein n=1 Tax=Thecamonas trahens ATCC 50062 TaxID=461836 RepID=A0A0L0DS13_THETB|nr:hypothetical protein AMSG_01688 [Thecamonas trahens ATCC 50062]KNC54836.1 hypothetical protein AMSG_01688 [Thecamonas trahens ATCC 50062]|eukprot:XP_013761733.1 hypothetical protein AMSG_01688 [Thecamonas trahens ATCC 50062]